MRKLKVLGLSDYGHTGIAESLRAPLIHWHEQGHEIWQLVLGFNGWTVFANPDDYPYRERLLRIHSNGMDDATRFGQTSMAQAVKLAKPDVVISSFDVWMVRYLSNPEADPAVQACPNPELVGLETRPFKHIGYFPLDGLLENKYLPRGLDEMIAGMDIPVTYSNFARDAVERDIGLKIPMIPISHNPVHYHKGDKMMARRRLSLPEDKFIVAMVGTNQYRKLWGEFIGAAARLAKAHDDVCIIPWTTWDLQIHGGFDIQDLIYRAGVASQTVNPQGSVGQFSEKMMADFYRACDVVVLTTVGEGAGLPPIRARACGTPALVSANTSNIEFVADPFELVTSRQTHLDNGSNIARFTTDVDELYEKLETLYRKEGFRVDLGERAAEAMMKYSTPAVLPQWDALLEAI